MNGINGAAPANPHRTDEYMTSAEVKAIRVGQSCFQCNEMRTASDCDMSHGRCSNCVYYCKPNTKCEPSTKSFEYHLYNQAASAEDKKLRQPKTRKRPNRKRPGYGLRPNGPAKLLPPELINEPLKYLQPTPRYVKENEGKQAAQMRHEDDTIREADGISSAAGAMPGSSVAGSSNFSSGFSCPVPVPIPATAPPSCMSGSYNMSDHHSTPLPSNTQGPSYRTAPSYSTIPSRLPGLAYPQVSSHAQDASSTSSPYHALDGRDVISGAPTHYEAISPRGGSSLGHKNGLYSNPPPAMPVYDSHPHMASQNVQYQWRKAAIAAQVAPPVAAPLPPTSAPSTAAPQSRDCSPQEPSLRLSKRLKDSLEPENSEARWAQQPVPQQSSSAPSREPPAQINLLKRPMSQVELEAEKMKEEEPCGTTMQRAETSEDVYVKIETHKTCVARRHANLSWAGSLLGTF